MKIFQLFKIFTSFLVVIFVLATCKKEESQPTGTVQLASITIGTTGLDLQGLNTDIPVDSIITIKFNDMIDTQSAESSISLKKDNSTPVPFTKSFKNNSTIIELKTENILENQSDYYLAISNSLKGASGQTFPGITVNFSTENGKLQIETITINGVDFSTDPIRDVDWENMEIEINFSEMLNPDNYQNHFFLSGGVQKNIQLSTDHKKITIVNTENLNYYSKYYFFIYNTLVAANGFSFDGFNNTFYTKIDSSLKFPLIQDDELLDLVQEKTFGYFYDFAEPNSGLARERNTSGDIVTSGGSGFGVMALIVGMERTFITRQEGIDRLDKILTFLETCDRFHGAWPHWLYGSTGEVRPFSVNDDGADLVETSYMIQGLYTMRQYLNPGTPNEEDMINRINTLINGVEWDWFTRGQNVLYWHWSPTVGWAMNMQIQGYNETLITYIMAAASTTHGIEPAVYHEGYAKNGGIQNGNTYYGYTLPLGYGMGGPLFFVHYSFLGLDPRNLQDMYANYWEQNVNQSLINWAYCVDNPKNWVGYSDACWGLTASDNPWGYNAHSPSNDLGVITPTAAVSSLPYTPEQSMEAIHHFYYLLGDRLWGEYGFYDAFDVTEGWWATSYLAIDQGPIVCMIENHRTGLLWDLFMSCPEVQNGLTNLDFSY
ncbi:MAG: Ig-like domain-containing protein [Bacteroidales bacterium]|nr:Ig-like domain-containing protein [Bacteroidales bacterium]